MDTKLTLKMESEVILRAKEYAKTHQTSLSKLIENYLQSIVSTEEKEEIEISPLVKKLTGVVKASEVSEQKDYAQFLNQKYL